MLEMSKLFQKKHYLQNSTGGSGTSLFFHELELFYDELVVYLVCLYIIYK